MDGFAGLDVSFFRTDAITKDLHPFLVLMIENEECISLTTLLNTIISI